MNEADKYKDLRQHLSESSLQSFQGSHNNSSLYFFKMLQNIHVDTIIAKADIDELKQKVRFMQDRLKEANVRANNKKINQTVEPEQKRTKNHQNGITKQYKFTCEFMDCGQTFSKLSELKFHQIFEHDLEKAGKDQIFKIQIKKESEF